MEGQYSLFDYMEPQYNGSLDEIVRLSAERKIQDNITLQKCCNHIPAQKFRSCHEYFVECGICGKRTKYYPKMYQAMQSWNKGIYEKAKAPIYHVSLNHVWEECPTCKAYNKATHDVRGADGRFYPMRYERCPECNQLFDWSENAVEKATKYSKDYLEHIRMKELQK